MAEAELEAGLQSLKQLLEQMKALLAWQRFKISEAKQRPIMNIRFNDTTNMDLMDRHSSFLTVSTRIHRFLDKDNAKISKAEKSRIKSELLTMEYQVHYLGSGIRFF
jgi:hypothetical protein